jgi:N-terminal region of glycosyl transferase group 7/N-terminal domain of galactosyltransferase
MKRLSVVVPYRAREAHLRFFVTELRNYFNRDKLDREIPYRVLIVEQNSELPFNRGALCNIGFALSRDDSDYTCFHDVDYLPVWADYSWSDVPACIVWYGAEERPIAPGRSNRVVKHNLAEFFGGVTLTPNLIFAQVNGYANSYWGWGSEDRDLRARLMASGLSLGRRKGTFYPLDHDSEGYRLDGSRRPIGLLNYQLYRARWFESAGNAMEEDGLKSVSYEIVDRFSIPNMPGERPALWERIVVRLLMQPSPEQLKAIKSTSQS